MSSAGAADSTEAWPELSVFVRLDEDSRLYLDASYARGKESDARSLDLSAYVDISLQPMLRPDLWTQDWQRNRYLWTRFGYTRVYKASSGPAEVAEDRGVASVYGRFPLSDGAGLEGRARADLRWIGGERSTRYRLRAEANRETTVLDHTVVAYANIEWFYDTRYSGWSRWLAQAGPEITLSKAFRCEVYLARQVDRLPAAASLNAVGVVAKWYY